MSTASTPAVEQRTITSPVVRYEGSAPVSMRTTEAQTTIWTSVVTPGLHQIRQMLDERRWDTLFHDPRSDRFLDDLVEEIISESNAGLTQDLDELL